MWAPREGSGVWSQTPLAAQPQDGSSLTWHVLVFHFNTLSFNLYPFQGTLQNLTRSLGTLARC